MRPVHIRFVFASTIAFFMCIATPQSAEAGPLFASKFEDTRKAAQSRAEFCQAIREPGYFQKLLADSDNRLAFVNGAHGIAGGGVCWWHNRIQRAALYLAVFRPEKAKPSRQKALQIIEQLKSMDRVIEIPGYANLREFSADYSREMIASLENWQVADGIFGGGWINGLARTPQTPAENWNILLNLKKRTDRGRIPLIIINQPNSVISHSALVADVHMYTKDFAAVALLDPNFPKLGIVTVAQYQNGIYLFPITMIGYESDYEKFAAAHACYCQKKCARR